MTRRSPVIPQEMIDRRILLIRGHRVIVDADLALLFGVSTKALNQAVKRNADRFPEDFSFRMTAKEKAEVVTNCDHLSKLRFTRVRPNAFTEHDAIMAANVLNSPGAIRARVAVVRAFVRLRQAWSTHREQERKLVDLERRIGRHDEALAELLEALRSLMDPSPAPRRERIGFHAPRRATREHPLRV